MARPRVIYEAKPGSPLGVEIWQPAPELLAGWRPPSPSDYRGAHGLRAP